MAAVRVFVSYSHDSDPHRAWVLKLATDLRAASVDASLDQWDLTPGQDTSVFMQRAPILPDPRRCAQGAPRVRPARPSAPERKRGASLAPHRARPRRVSPARGASRPRGRGGRGAVHAGLGAPARILRMRFSCSRSSDVVFPVLWIVDSGRENGHGNIDARRCACDATDRLRSAADTSAPVNRSTFR